MQSAFTVARSDDDLFVRHNALPSRLLSSLRFRSILARSQRDGKPFILSDLIDHGDFDPAKTQRSWPTYLRCKLTPLLPDPCTRLNPRGVCPETVISFKTESTVSGNRDFPKLTWSQRLKHMAIITFAQVKGGSGKTTTAMWHGRRTRRPR